MLHCFNAKIKKIRWIFILTARLRIIIYCLFNGYWRGKLNPIAIHFQRFFFLPSQYFHLKCGHAVNTHSANAKHQSFKFSQIWVPLLHSTLTKRRSRKLQYTHFHNFKLYLFMLPGTLLEVLNHVKVGL